jgi:hypothetical protein
MDKRKIGGGIKMSLIEILKDVDWMKGLKGAARTSLLTAAFVATAAFTHLYTKIDVAQNMKEKDNEIIAHHNDLTDSVNGLGRYAAENRKGIEQIDEGLGQVIEWVTKEGVKYRIAVHGLGRGLKNVHGRVQGIEQKEKAKFDNKYDFNNSLVDYNQQGLERIAESLYTVKTETVFEKKEGEKTITQKVNQKGGATAILNGQYLITCDHVVNREQLTRNLGFVQMKIPGYEKKSETTYLQLEETELELEAVLKDKENDIAIFKAPDGYQLNSLPCKLGNSDELEKGNFLYVIGVPGNSGINVREGIYSTKTVPEFLKQQGFKTENAFMASCGFNPGDSGTMIIAIRDGQYELAGLPQGTFFGQQKMSWAIGMSPIKKFVRKHLEKNDLVEKYKDLYDGLK